MLLIRGVAYGTNIHAQTDAIIVKCIGCSIGKVAAQVNNRQGKGSDINGVRVRLFLDEFWSHEYIRPTMVLRTFPQRRQPEIGEFRMDRRLGMHHDIARLNISMHNPTAMDVRNSNKALFQDGDNFVCIQFSAVRFQAPTGFVFHN